MELVTPYCLFILYSFKVNANHIGLHLWCFSVTSRGHKRGFSWFYCHWKSRQSGTPPHGEQSKKQCPRLGNKLPKNKYYGQAPARVQTHACNIFKIDLWPRFQNLRPWRHLNFCMGWCTQFWTLKCWLDDRTGLPCHMHARVRFDAPNGAWGHASANMPVCLLGLPLPLERIQPVQPNPVEGSLEFDLLVLDPDTIITFGNPPTI